MAHLFFWVPDLYWLTLPNLVLHLSLHLSRSLQDDPSFHQSLVNTVSEPVPYFIQIKNSSNPTASPFTASTLDPTAAGGTAPHNPPSSPPSSPPPQRLQGGEEQLQELPDPPPHPQLDVQKAIRRLAGTSS